MNIRQKGQNGEREIAKVLNGIVGDVRDKLNLTPLEKNQFIFQRNQNQTAIGGSDLSNNLGLSIEIKRQERLTIDTWWEQCLSQARVENKEPILLFRQNNKKWRCCMNGFAICVIKTNIIRVEISFDDFKHWFRDYYESVAGNSKRTI